MMKKKSAVISLFFAYLFASSAVIVNGQPLIQDGNGKDNEEDGSSLISQPDILRLKGSALEMGMRYGSERKEDIRKNIELFWHKAKSSGLSRDYLMYRGYLYEIMMQEAHPEALVELDAVSFAAGIDYQELLAFNAMQETVFNDGCTNLLAHGTATKSAQVFFHKNRDVSGDPVQIVIERLSGPFHRYVAITSAGSSGVAMGINEYGVSTGNTNLQTWDTGAGLGNLDINRIILERSADALGAVNVVQHLHRRGGSNFHVTDAENALFIESTHSDMKVGQVTDSARANTNHYVLTDMQNYESGGTTSSHHRYIRANALLQQNLGQITHETMIAISRDRYGSYPISRNITVSAATFDNDRILMYYQMGRPSVTTAVHLYDLGELVHETYILEPEEDMAMRLELLRNYPNPFNNGTTLSYVLPWEGDVTLRIYDITGRLIEVLLEKHQAPGRYDIRFSAPDLSSGVYIYQLEVNGNKLSRTMVYNR